MLKQVENNQTTEESEYFPTPQTSTDKFSILQQPIQPIPCNLAQEKRTQEFNMIFTEIMSKLTSDNNPTMQSTSQTIPLQWNGYYYSKDPYSIKHPTHPIKPKTPCLNKNSKYIMNTYEQPIFLLDPIARELVQPDTHWYKEIYLLLQDSHVKDQRIFYETHKSHLVNVYKWKKAPIPPVEQLYLLVLVERFNKESLVDWKLRWYNAFKETMDKEFPICTICSIPRIRAMCREKEWKHPIYVCF